MSKHIIDIEPGDIYKHLPSGKVYIFRDEGQIAWNTINPDNFEVLDTKDPECKNAIEWIG